MGQKQIIALIGMLGCGKTTVGRILASKSNAVFYDLDACLAKLYDKPVAQLYTELGESAFRAAEAKALARLETEFFSAPYPVILSCGGGVVCGEASRTWLARHAYTIWIMRKQQLVLQNPRVLHRPPVCDDPARYAALLQMRAPLYRACCNLQVENHHAVRTALSLLCVLQKKELLQTKTETDAPAAGKM